MMKRTPISGRFTKQLVRVYDQVCFAALQQWQFTQQLSPLVGNAPKQFTTEAFPENPFSETIYRRVGELPSFSDEAEQIALQMGVIAAVEYVLAYIEEVQTFREQFEKDNVEPIRDDAGEEQLRLKISRWSGSSPASGYFRTLGYFRLLRNHYAHVNEKLNPSFKTYIRSNSNLLNSFWDNGVTDLHGIDFRTLPLTSLTPNLAFGVMNLMRVCVWHVDEMVAETLPIADVVRWVVLQIRTAPQARQISFDRLSAKVAARLRMEWRIELPLSDIIEMVNEDNFEL